VLALPHNVDYVVTGEMKKAAVLPELPPNGNAPNRTNVKISIKTPPGMFVVTDPA